MTEDLRSLIAETKRLDGEATPGDWDARIREFSNMAKAKHIWSEYGFIGRFDSESAEKDAELTTYYRSAAPKLADALEKALDQQEALLRLLVKSDAKILDLSEENRVMREALTLTEACEQAAACKIEQLTEENRVMREALVNELIAHKATLMQLMPHVGVQPGKDYLVTGYVAEQSILDRVSRIDKALDTIDRQRESGGREGNDV